MGIRASKLILQLIGDSSIPTLSARADNSSLILRRNRQNLGRNADLHVVAALSGFVLDRTASWTAAL